MSISIISGKWAIIAFRLLISLRLFILFRISFVIRVRMNSIIFSIFIHRKTASFQFCHRAFHFLIDPATEIPTFPFRIIPVVSFNFEWHFRRKFLQIVSQFRTEKVCPVALLRLRPSRTHARSSNARAHISSAYKSALWQSDSSLV